MLGGSDDGQPSVRPRRPPRGGGHWPAWPAWGLSRPHPRPPRPGHRRHLGEGVQEPSHYDTGSSILEESSHPNGQQTPLPIPQVRKLLFLFTTNISARAPLNIKPQQSTRAHAGRRGGEAEAGLQESVQVNMIFSLDISKTNQCCRIDMLSFQRYCQGVEHVLEEERQVQAEHPAQLPVLLSERRSTENCKFCVRIKLWGVKWGNMWEQSKTFYCARDFRYLFIRNPWQLDIYQTKRRRIPQLQSYHASVCRDCSTLPPKDRRPPRCCLTFPLVQQAAQSRFLMMLIVPGSKIPRP